MKARAACVLLLVASASTRSPQGAGPLTPEQALARRQLVDLRPAPDGGRIAFTVIEPPKGERRSKHVFVLDVRAREARQFTRSLKSEWAPRFSPDGKRLAFLSDREEKAQLWVMPADGGEAVRVAREEAAGEGVAWSPDGKQIAYLAKEPKSEAQETRDKEKDDARVVDRDDRRARLFLVDVAARTSRLLTPAPWQVSDVTWAPKGDRLLVIATDHPESDRWTERILSVQATDGTLSEIAAPHGPIRGLRPSPDGGSLAYLASRVDGPEPEDLYVVPLAGAGGAPRDLTGASLDRDVEEFAWWRDGSLMALVADGVGSQLYAVDPDGKTRVLPPPPSTVSDIALLGAPPAAKGAASAPAADVLAFVGEKAAQAPEIWLWPPGQAPQPVTHLNDSWKGIEVATPEIVRYPSFDRTEIEALLLKPLEASPGTSLPLVVLAHGGPTGRWADRFEPWGQLLAARGFAVLYPNVRGSTGYGHHFVEMNRRDWGGGDFKDLMAGVDFVIARGVAHPDHLGIGGWSYGGYMAMWAVTQTPRFKAAVAGAGLCDLASEYGTEDEPAYDEWFYGLPYEAIDGFLKSSPITRVRDAATPTLILQGEADTVDPPGQSQEFYRALKRYGVPADFVVYPREGHGLQEEKHLRDRLDRVVAWFQKYVK